MFLCHNRTTNGATLFIATVLMACSESKIVPFNADPGAQILSHQNGDVVLQDTETSFLGNATDSDNETASLVAAWFVDGDMACPETPVSADGSSACFYFVPPGAETLRLVVFDPDGGSGEDIVQLQVQPSFSPSAVIEKPVATDELWSNRWIDFVGVVSDPEDDSNALTVQWTSSLDGVLMDLNGTPETDGTVTGQTKLSEGEHQIELSVQDSTGMTASDVVTVVVGEGINTPPEAPVITITPAIPNAGVDALHCQITTEAYDIDGDPVSYLFEWEVDGVPYAGTPETSTHPNDTISTDDLEKNQVWRCSCTPHDGTESGPSAYAQVVVRSDCDDIWDGLDNNSDGLVDNVSLACADAKFRGEFAWDYAGATHWNGSGQQIAGPGDVNGDGFDDLVIGAFGADDTGDEAGVVYLLVGGATGFRGKDLSTADARLTGESIESWAGYAVAGADLNGDGFSDLVVGAPFSPFEAGNGAVYIVNGSSAGPGDMSLSDADAILAGESYKGRAGDSVSNAGDVNGDGVDDLLIGAHGVKTSVETGGTVIYHTSAVYVVFGSKSGLADMDLSDADIKLIGDNSNWAPNAMATTGAGDVNGDGFDDFMLGGSWGGDGSPRPGAAVLFLGSADFPSSVLWTETGEIFTGEAPGDLAGQFLSGGDFDWDGYSDVVISGQGNDEGGSGAGAAYVLYGSSTGISGMSLSAADAKLIGVEKSDAAGRRVSSPGDVNHDGFADLLIGANSAETLGGSNGTVYLVLGSSAGISDMPLTDADAFFMAHKCGPVLGESLTGLGDVNGDGHIDIAMSAGRDYADDSYTGVTFVLYGAGL